MLFMDLAVPHLEAVAAANVKRWPALAQFVARKPRPLTPGTAAKEGQQESLISPCPNRNRKTLNHCGVAQLLPVHLVQQAKYGAMAMRVWALAPIR